MTVTSVPLGACAKPGACAKGACADGRECLAQIGLIRTGIGAFFAGILNTSRARFIGVFSDNESDHEIERLLNSLDNFVRSFENFFARH